MLAQRLAMNQAALANPPSNDEAPQIDLSRPTLVSRIRHMFRLDGL